MKTEHSAHLVKQFVRIVVRARFNCGPSERSNPGCPERPILYRKCIGIQKVLFARYRTCNLIFEDDLRKMKRAER